MLKISRLKRPFLALKGQPGNPEEDGDSPVFSWHLGGAFALVSF